VRKRLIYSVVVATVGLVMGPGLGSHAQTVATDGGPTRPILLVSSTENPFGSYYAEILSAEGLNAFSSADISTISAATLGAYDVVILADMPLTSDQVSMFSSWVAGGGNLIAMRPSKKLAGLLGLNDLSSTLADA